MYPSTPFMRAAKSGDVVVMNAHLWHAGTANHTARRRLALPSFYCRSDKPQQQYQKALLRPDVQAAMAPELRDILALDDAMNEDTKTALRNFQIVYRLPVTGEADDATKDKLLAVHDNR